VLTSRYKRTHFVRKTSTFNILTSNETLVGKNGTVVRIKHIFRTKNFLWLTEKVKDMSLRLSGNSLKRIKIFLCANRDMCEKSAEKIKHDRKRLTKRVYIGTLHVISAQFVRVSFAS